VSSWRFRSVEYPFVRSTKSSWRFLQAEQVKQKQSLPVSCNCKKFVISCASATSAVARKRCP
jgi:hypothetical protein